MRTLTVTLRGLIACATRGSNSDAEFYCHPEGGAHRPTLAIPVKALDIELTTWKPDLIVHDDAGHQLAVWSLVGAQFKLGPGSAQTRIWTGLREGLQFSRYHKNSAVQETSVVDRVLFDGKYEGAKLTLSGGTLRFEDSKAVRVDLTHKSTTEGRVLAGTFEWRTEVVEADTVEIVNSRSTGPSGSPLAIALNVSPAAVDIRLRVSNIATEAFDDAFGHLANYYEFMDLDASDSQITLFESQSDRDEYDCVPPVTLD